MAYPAYLENQPIEIFLACFLGIYIIDEQTSAYK